MGLRDYSVTRYVSPGGNPNAEAVQTICLGASR